SPVKLFILAGHRNMEGERAFVQELQGLEGKAALLKDNPKIAYKYNLGGGVKQSDGWEPLGPAEYYDTFGPELSFGQTLQAAGTPNIAIAKFTHSGSQMNDWTPEGSVARTRHLYPSFISFIQDTVKDLKHRGHEVELAGIFYHAGENDMSMGPYRQKAAQWLQATIALSRQDLAMPKLMWFVSQQPPTDVEELNRIDVTADVERLAAGDPAMIHIKAFDLPVQEKQLVIDTRGIVRLGEVIAREYLAQE
ncbi:MAG: sialate O-acetylesterase, partial [Planctomycetes bacterium]|nr:sialate O-acetylesterase [Planctomycetota bacterium]